MAFLVAKVHLVNGDLMGIPLSLVYLESLRRLEEQGLKGKQLVHALLTDDWATPPATVELAGEAADGTSISITIPYE